MPTSDVRIYSEIKICLENAGDVVPAAFDDFIADYQAGKFTEDGIAAYVQECRHLKPHRFTIQGDDDAALAHRAFVLHNLSAQGELVRKVGLDRAREIAKQYSTELGSTKRGTEPDAVKSRRGGDHGSNPWAAIPGQNTDPKTGRYLPSAITRQASIVKSLGLDKARAFAAAVGAKVGDVKPPKAA
jgi:hypothetical protein